MRKVLFSTIALLVLAGCNKVPPVLTDERLDNIVQVLLREPGQYTIFVQNTDTSEIERRYLRVKDANMKIFMDVSPDQSPWLLTRRGKYGDSKRAIWKAELHIRSIADLGTAGYRQSSGKSSHPVQPQMLMR